MKEILLLLVAAVLAALPIVNSKSDQDKSLARVNRVQGYYIFMQSQPVTEYEVLGTVKKTGITWSGHPEEMYNTLIKRMKKDFPKSEAIIFDDVAMEHATCIMFK